MSGNILFAMITRLRDGLPLSATTDHDPSQRVLESKKYAKILSKKASQFPDRCSMFTGSHWLYFISSLGVCFIMMCEESYSSVLAFCFLDELQREFISLYENKKVDNAIRPYALIDFDRVIQKTKQRYNNAMTLNARQKYSDMTLEVKLRPPYRISIDDIESTGRRNINGISPHHIPSWQAVNVSNNGDLPKPANFRRPFSRLDWMAKLLVFLSVLCGTLNLARIMAVLTFGTSPYEPDEKTIVLQAMALLVFSALLNYYQSFKLWTSLGQRSLRQLLACVLVIVCNYSLYKLYWRFLLTSSFHSLVAVLVAWKMRAGSGDFKLPNYTV
ncbi:vesicle-trafficking protein SEC22a-like [Lytechinus pictus]|uniref:vesicle-trafficking protein SEC22a-like n=1 Tax=Lytechinus pictus TaxID=7653 RepID=UPI0030B9DD01